MPNTVANMATFPARRHVLEQSLSSIACQVARVNLILNEYEEVPDFLGRFKNVHPIIPDRDLKDTGKFFPKCSQDDLVFLVDDDLIYSPEYVSLLLAHANSLDLNNNVLGLHGTIYRRNIKSLRSRKRYDFSARLGKPVFVDQLGTGTVLVKGKNLPSFDFMSSSQKFVDVRFAKWCFERQLDMVSVPRPKGTITSIRVSGGSIYDTFTRKSPDHVISEVRSFAGKGSRIKLVCHFGVFGLIARSLN